MSLCSSLSTTRTHPRPVLRKYLLRILIATPLSWRWGSSSFKNSTLHPGYRRNSTFAFPSGLLINEGEGPSVLAKRLPGAGKVPKRISELGSSS